jgi:hypothetical protein
MKTKDALCKQETLFQRMKRKDLMIKNYEALNKSHWIQENLMMVIKEKST